MILFQALTIIRLPINIGSILFEQHQIITSYEEG